MAIGSLRLYYYNKVDGTEKLTFTVEEVDFEPTLAYLLMPFFEQDADQDIPLVPWGKEAYTAGVLPPSFQVLTPYGFLTVNLVKLTIEGDHLPEGYRAVLPNGRSLYIGDYPEICIGFPGPTPHEIEEMGKNPRCKHFRRGRLLQRQMEISLRGPYGCVPNQFPVLAGASAEFSMEWFYDVHNDQFMETSLLEECSSMEEETLANAVPEEVSIKSTFGGLPFGLMSAQKMPPPCGRGQVGRRTPSPATPEQLPRETPPHYKGKTPMWIQDESVLRAGSTPLSSYIPAWT